MNFAPELRYAVLELTNRCNLRCVHCASNSGAARCGEYSTEQWIWVVRELAELGTREVTLIGGEMLLHPGWERIGQEVVAQGMRLILVTNGLLVDEQTKKRILAMNPWIVGVSLDGATPETVRAIRKVDAFDHVYRLLLDLAAVHPRVNAVTTFCRLNFHEFDDLARLFAGTGVTWQVQIANPSGDRFRPEWSLSVEEYAIFCEKVTHILQHEPNLWLCPMDDFGYHPLSPALANYHRRFPGCMAGIQVIGIRRTATCCRACPWGTNSCAAICLKGLCPRCGRILLASSVFETSAPISPANARNARWPMSAAAAARPWPHPTQALSAKTPTACAASKPAN
jgi:MoaA/NifB/PqqE/SkfB family radical SAM enzyme